MISAWYPYVKALHLIFVITWFAGLFYLPRLFIYQIESASRPSPEKEILSRQMQLMARRLWFIITWPSAVLAIAFGSCLLILSPALLDQPWMQAKLCFVFILILYHMKTHQMFKQLQHNEVPYSSRFMRIWNEGATLILFAVIFLAILKNAVDWIYGMAGLLLLAGILMLGIRLYRRMRQGNQDL